ncbi:alpha-amylase family glycosyl hydrolase [Marispirochaeta sp.]|uniref:alpha-amylase family glycosyl hydrolase n=1 Tax=Marispirochaeta sp. TaxID=2038653 RepID=UPI0029C80040|nr:alpha-amylase family glycosyl hydrolase [Marispirochaeta sp.]
MIINKRSRRTYKLGNPLLDSEGRPDLSSFHSVRSICHLVNSARGDEVDPEKILRAGELYGLGMLDRIYRLILRKQLREEFDLSEKTLERLFSNMETTASFQELETLINQEFPAEPSGPRPSQELLADLILLRLTNENPASERIRELIDDSPLEQNAACTAVLDAAAQSLFASPPQAEGGETLLQMLRRPFMLHPHSVRQQLQHIRDNWSDLVCELILPLLSSLDFLAEEERPYFSGGPGEQHPYAYTDGDFNGFSPDQAWMPTVVMIAKNTLVWLHQLSAKYGKPCKQLDDIPNQELALLSERGFTALWLIGIWERSSASKRIKRLFGNQEAEASAYSLKNYRVSHDMGGEPALEALRIKAAKFGIRLASDMVPNHTGIDADWIYEHPEYYLQVPVSPYPSYSFSGENLSDREGYATYLDDHYFDRSDAAVVFKHVEQSTGRVRYIYHGNDGTHMPWNDTAQLNYLDSRVREAVLQTIIQVARIFPIIRFDAAMTLAKEHIRRLWFPEPGKGGSIPSRAEHALSHADFERAIPEEFWREVVDRVGREVPGTLLLAEAFWMMEGYFVRSLGMHRVYNSAFMNMLKNEENDKYRITLKNTLEFDREILKRFVNFMNNPDEETALAQFGSEDKYFGICTLLVTMPGLPMFGHGQIEGFSEKYGMEYSRAYKDESPDAELVKRHEREIFPLLKRRALFAESEEFTLYDFIGPSGVNQNVFAYTNRSGEDTALVLYNNSLESAAGSIRISVPYRDKEREGALRQRSLGEALGVPDNPRRWIILRQHGTDLEFIRNCRDIARRGLTTVLPGYGCQVYLDLRVVSDDPKGSYRSIAEKLNGSGCSGIDREIRLMHMKPLHQELAQALRPEIISVFREAMFRQKKAETGFFASWAEDYSRFLGIADEHDRPKRKTIPSAAQAVLEIATFDLSSRGDIEEELAGFRGYLQRGLEMRPEAPAVFSAWCLIHGLSEALGNAASSEVSRSLIDDWHLGTPLRDIFSHAGLSWPQADYAVSLVKLLTSYQDWHLRLKDMAGNRYLAKLIHEQEIQDFLLVNRYNNILWFNKDRFEDMAWWFFCIAVVQLTEMPESSPHPRIESLFETLHNWLECEERSGFRLTRLIDLLNPQQAKKSDSALKDHR